MKLIDYKSLKLSSALGWGIVIFSVYVDFCMRMYVNSNNKKFMDFIPTPDGIVLISFLYTLLIGCLALIVPIEFFKTKNVSNKKHNILSNILFYIGVVFNILFLLFLYIAYMGIGCGILSSPIIVVVLYIFILCFYYNRPKNGQ